MPTDAHSQVFNLQPEQYEARSLDDAQQEVYAAFEAEVPASTHNSAELKSLFQEAPVAQPQLTNAQRAAELAQAAPRQVAAAIVSIGADLENRRVLPLEPPQVIRRDAQFPVLGSHNHTEFRSAA